MTAVSEDGFGKVPRDWKHSTLGGVAKFQTGGTPSRNEPRYWENGDIPWVKTAEIDYRVIDVTQEKITRLGLESSSTKVFPAGTLLVAMYGQGVTRGRAGILGIDAATNQACAAITPHDENEILTRFVYFFLQYQYEALRQMGHGANQRNLNMALLRGFPIAYPPLSEQRRIAGVLGLVQRAVEQQERLRTLVAELKQTLLHHLFTHGLRGEPQKPTDLGPIPQSWELRPCDELCEMISVGVVVRPASHYVPSGVPAFRSFNVREDRLNPSDLVYFSEETNNTKLAKSKLRKGDVLVVRTGYPGTSCVVPDEYDGANCIDLVIVRPKQALVRSGFLSRFFNTPAGKRQAVAAKHGLAQQHLNVAAVKRTQIPVPSLEEQTEIDAAMATVQRKLALIESRKIALTSLFRTLLHQLMTAQLRVSDLDVESLLSPAVPDSSRRLVSH